MDMNDNECEMLRAIACSPEDNRLRLRYANWLICKGRPEQAQFIRLQIKAVLSSNRRFRKKLLLEALHLGNIHAANWFAHDGLLMVACWRGLPFKARFRRAGQALDSGVMDIWPLTKIIVGDQPTGWHDPGRPEGERTVFRFIGHGEPVPLSQPACSGLPSDVMMYLHRTPGDREVGFAGIKDASESLDRAVLCAGRTRSGLAASPPFDTSRPREAENSPLLTFYLDTDREPGMISQR